MGLALPMGPAVGAPAAPAGPGGAAAAAEDFQQVTLVEGVAEKVEPMTLAVLPDRSVLHTSRDGILRRTDAAGTTTVAGGLDVYSHDEEGLQGVAGASGTAFDRTAPRNTSPHRTGLTDLPPARPAWIPPRRPLRPRVRQRIRVTHGRTRLPVRRELHLRGGVPRRVRR
jgi:hypothetical protein